LGVGGGVGLGVGGGVGLGVGGGVGVGLGFGVGWGVGLGVPHTFAHRADELNCPPFSFRHWVGHILGWQGNTVELIW
jgi:hypothetical protein